MTDRTLRNRVQTANLRLAKLQGVQASDTALQEATTKDVALAKGRSDLGPEMGRLFEAIQNIQHERSVGAFQNLLTAVLHDVLPHEGQVRLVPSYKNNSTYLDILLEKNGGLEDILEGNGGAVTNVISTGLRYAALSRTSNRRMMVLDEPDCWIKPERVAAFVNVVAEVSQNMDAQTCFITHHDTAFFEGKMNVVKFIANDDGKVFAERQEPLVSNWESEDQVGIRQIELINVRRHEHTIVPCFPGATAYIGDNNLGKSTAISTAMRAVAYGESDDSLIRHGCTEAKIILHLEEQQRIEWSRDTKRSPSVVYKLYRGDELVSEGRAPGRNQAPEWVADVLKIDRVDELDLQVGNQKFPIFLLGESSPKRAKILSTGQESGRLKSLMKEYDEIRTADRETVRSGEMLLARLKEKLRYLEPTTGLSQQVNSLLDSSEDVFSRVEQRERISSTAEKLQLLHQASAQSEQQFSALETLPTVPNLHENSKLLRVTSTIDQAQATAHIADPLALPDLPVLSDVSTLLRVGQRLGALQQIVANAPASLPQLPVLPELKLPVTLFPAIDRLEKQMTSTKEAGVLFERDQVAEDTAAQELAKLQAELGECPLCGHAFEEAHTRQPPRPKGRGLESERSPSRVDQTQKGL